MTNAGSPPDFFQRSRFLVHARRIESSGNKKDHGKRSTAYHLNHLLLLFEIYILKVSTPLIA